MARRRRLVIGTLAAALITSCSGMSAPPPTHVDSAGYAVFTGTLHLAGELAVDGRFTDSITGRGETCGQYAYGQVAATTLWVTPTPSNAAAVAGHRVSLTAGVAGSGVTFHGPGVYTEPAAQVNVLMVDDLSFLQGDHATTTITVTSSGAGSMVFSDMADSYSGEVETGEETWTCTSMMTPRPSGTSAQGSPASRPSGAVPLLVGTLSISGQFVSTGGFTTPAMIEVGGLQTPIAPGTSCATYAKGYPAAPGQGGGTGFSPPLPATPGPPSVSLIVALPSGYHGPGSYATGASYTISGTVVVGVQTAEGPSFYIFRSAGGATSFTVGADGSGTLEFSSWHDTETRGGNGTGTLSGAMAWTCR